MADLANMAVSLLHSNRAVSDSVKGLHSYTFNFFRESLNSATSLCEAVIWQPRKTDKGSQVIIIKEKTE